METKQGRFVCGVSRVKHENDGCGNPGASRIGLARRQGKCCFWKAGREREGDKERKPDDTSTTQHAHIAAVESNAARPKEARKHRDDQYTRLQRSARDAYSLERNEQQPCHGIIVKPVVPNFDSTSVENATFKFKRTHGRHKNMTTSLKIRSATYEPNRESVDESHQNRQIIFLAKGRI